jgi:hypothetical protein
MLQGCKVTGTLQPYAKTVFLTLALRILIQGCKVATLQGCRPFATLAKLLKPIVPFVVLTQRFLHAGERFSNEAYLIARAVL